MEFACIVDQYQRADEVATLAAIRADFPQYVKCVVAGNGLLHQLMKRGKEEKWDSFKFYFELILLNREFERISYLSFLQMNVDLDVFLAKPQYRAAYERLFRLKYPNVDVSKHFELAGPCFTDMHGYKEFGNGFLDVCVRAVIRVHFS